MKFPVQAEVREDVQHAHQLLALCVSKLRGGRALKPGEEVLQYNRLREAVAILDGFLRVTKGKETQ
jgi:hypothetical protein